MPPQTITAPALEIEREDAQTGSQLGREWRLKNWGIALFLAALWAIVLIHLAIDWRFDPEYNFGWFIPFMMTIVLGSRHFKGRPSLTANRARMTASVFAVSVAVLVMWPVIRIVGIANPDWHIVTWITVVAGFVLTLTTLRAAGGARMMWHYGIPFLMIAAVVPWPYVLEQQLISSLKTANAVVVTEVLQLGGIAAVRGAGGIIEMPNAVLGIEEGCTGIRSLHLCLAIALFWGEWFRLNFKGRSALVGAAFLVAILVNVIRTLSLARIAHTSGAEVLSQWHDRAGILSQAIVVAICWILTGWLIARRQRWSRAHLKKAMQPTSRDSSESTGGIRIRGIAFCFAALWIFCSEAGARYWFTERVTDESRLQNRWRWSMPPAIEGLQRRDLPRKWLRLMAADNGFAGAWVNQNERLGRYLYSFYWRKGHPASLFATHHRPEDCLPGSGFELIDGPERIPFKTSGTQPFELNRYTFRSSKGIPVTVFHGTYADGRFTEGSVGGLTRQRRIERAWQGEGFPETRLLEVIFWDTEKEAAQTELAGLLNKMVMPATD